jgi:hypothetical protein
MVAHKMQEWLVTDEAAGRLQGVAVAARLRLRDELEPRGGVAGGGAEGGLVTGPHDDAHLVRTSGHGLFDDDLEGGLRDAVAIDEALQGKALLVASGGRNDGAFDFHDGAPVPRV